MNKLLATGALFAVVIFTLFQASCKSEDKDLFPPQPLKIITERLPNAAYGQEYYSTLAGTGGLQPYNWELSGKLPKGITFDTSIGEFRGKPGLDAESTTFDIRLYDSINKKNPVPVSRRYTLNVISGPFIASEKDLMPLKILTTSLPDGEVNSRYTANLSATGGLPPYKWQLSGALPEGILFDTASGLFAGTPVKNGKWRITIGLSDLLGKRINVAVPLDLVIKPQAVIRGEGLPLFRVLSTALPPAVVGKTYNVCLSATGGVSPYLWRAETLLPKGLEFDTDTGEISGTPTESGLFTLSFSAKDARSLTTSARTTIKLEVLPPAVNRAYPLKILTTSLPPAENDKFYIFSLSAQGGVMPYRWTCLTPLPPGIALKSETGILTGTPAETGSWILKLELADSQTPPSAAWRTLTFDVNGPDGNTASFLTWLFLLFNIALAAYLVRLYFKTKGKRLPAEAGVFDILTTILPTVREGEPYMTALTATGGVPPYKWEEKTPFPDGLSLDESSGIISGKPPYSHPGIYKIEIQVTDSSEPALTASTMLELEILSGMVEVNKKAYTLLAKDDKLFFESFPEGSGDKKLIGLNEIEKEGNPYSKLLEDIRKDNKKGTTYGVLWCYTTYPSGVKASLKAASLAEKEGIQFFSILKS